jgi:hypothetical protein
VLQLLREVQVAGAVGMRVEVDKAKGQTAVLFFQRDDVTPEITEKTAEIRRLLKLPAEGTKFTLIYSPSRGAAGELGVNSRSLMQIMGAFASYVDVPEADLQRHSALPAIGNDTAEGPHATRADSQQQRQARGCLCCHSLPGSLVLDRRRRLANEARAHSHHVFLYVGGRPAVTRIFR